MIPINLVYDPATGRLVYDPASGRLVCAGKGQLHVADYNYNKDGKNLGSVAAAESAMQADSWNAGFVPASDDAVSGEYHCSVGLRGWDLSSHIADGTQVGKIEIAVSHKTPWPAGIQYILGWRFTSTSTPDDDWAWVEGFTDESFSPATPQLLSVGEESDRYLWIVVRFATYATTWASVSSIATQPYIII